MRVLLCDDHGIVLEGMEAKLKAAGVEVVGLARTGEAALELEHKLAPDVLVLDLDLGNGMDGWEVLEKTKRRGGTNAPVLIASGSASSADVQGARDDGARGYVLKTTNTEELVFAIRRVASGDVYFSPDVQGVLLGLGAGGGLSEREGKVLKLMGTGATDEEIAGRLNVSRTTVRRVLDGLHKKAGIGRGGETNRSGRRPRKREELIRHAVERGWL